MSTVQCGFCTLGFILTCYTLMIDHPNAGGDLIEESTLKMREL